MATTTESVAPAEQPLKLDPENEADVKENEDTGLKRKALDDNEEDDSPKRARYDDDPEAEAESRRRSRSPSRSRRKEAASIADQERRRQVAQEEKKRGKRLFGGLMSTLNQTSTTTTQQKRRQEIERRQQERIQRQKAEDDQRRAEKLARLRDVRMAEQISFEEAVMKNKHSKRLAMARFLQTRSEPRIYFLPWKPTPEQEDVIEEQISRVRETIVREVEQFRARKQRHIERYGPPRHRSVTPDPPAATAVVVTRPESTGSASHAAAKGPQNEQQEQQQQLTPTEDMHHDQHDESGDVLVEAEEDMVIY